MIVDTVKANGIKSNLLKYANTAKIALEASIIFRLGKSPYDVKLLNILLNRKIL